MNYWTFVSEVHTIGCDFDLGMAILTPQQNLEANVPNETVEKVQFWHFPKIGL